MEKGAIRLCKRSAAIRVDRLGSATVWHAAWRAAFATALGLPPSVANNYSSGGARGAALERLVRKAAGPHKAPFGRTLRGHLQRPSWPEGGGGGGFNVSR